MATIPPTSHNNTVRTNIRQNTNGQTSAGNGVGNQTQTFIPPSDISDKPLNLNLGFNLPVGINAPSQMMGGSQSGSGQTSITSMLQSLLSSLTSSTGSTSAQTTLYLQNSGVYQSQPLEEEDTKAKGDDSGYWAALGYSDEGGDEGALQADPPPPAH